MTTQIELIPETTDVTILDRVMFAAQHMRRVEYENRGRPCRVHWFDARGEHVSEGCDLFEATEQAIASHMAHNKQISEP